MKEGSNYLRFFLLILFKPKKIITEIVSADLSKTNYSLILLSCISFLLYASVNSVSNDTDLIVVIGRSVLLGVILAPFFLYASSLVTYWLGKLFGGKATIKDIRIAICWSQVPMVLLLIVWPLIVGVFGKDIFMKIVTPSSLLLEYPNLFVSFIVINFLAWLWSVVIFTLALGQVQKITIWKAAINTILAISASFLVLFGVLMLTPLVLVFLTKV